MAKHTTWNPHKIIRDHDKDIRRLGLGKRLSPSLTAKLKAAVKKLDKDFLEDQAALIKDLAIDILENRNDRSDALKQRSVWGLVDGVAKHLDDTGFTPVFRKVADIMFRKHSLADPAIVALETQLIQGFLGLDKERAGRLGLSAADFATAMSLAESQKPSKHGINYLTSPRFTFRGAMLRACGRPDRLLEVHMKVSKVVAIVTFVANIVVLLIPVFGIPISIATIVVATIVAIVAGC